MPTCIEWAVERHQECNQTADQGYSECTQSRDEGYQNCCTWWPCSWLCAAWVWVSNIVCVAWTWVSNAVCISWTWISTSVCVLWDVVTTIANAILVTIESFMGWVLSAIAFIIELLEMIPVFGAIIRWVINIITLVSHVLVSLPDAFLGLIGIRPEKKLRICTVIVRDETGNPVADAKDVIPLLQLAVNVYKRDANVRIIPLRPLKYDTGFNGADTVDYSWITIDGSNSDGDTLDVPCDLSNEWWTGGSKFQLKSSTLCFFGNWRRVVGYGAPITCFVIRSMPGFTVGCSLFISDYVTVERDTHVTSPRTIAHEVGHASMLWHLCVDDDVTNLMAAASACNPPSTTAPDSFNPIITNWQALLIRASKHASYF